MKCTTDAERRAFILKHTRLQAPPHVPEVRLHLADESVPLWQMTDDDLEAIGLPPPFWAFAWAGGQGLARYLLDHRDQVEGRRVLDFASGSGVSGIAAALAGAGQVIATDIDPFCGPAISLNAAANDVEVRPVLEDVIGSDVDADVLLAGDAFYDRDFAAQLFRWFKTLTLRGTKVLIGDPGRAYLPQDQLTCVASYEVPVDRALEDSDVRRTKVWTLTSPG